MGRKKGGGLLDIRYTTEAYICVKIAYYVRSFKTSNMFLYIHL
jgi:hypothetical protein